MNIEHIIREYIQKSIHMSLATSRDNRPWVCELHFVYDDDLNLYWRSLPNRRHSIEIASNPFVSGNIIAQHDIDDPAHGIYFEGCAEMLTDVNMITQIYPLFRTRLHSNDSIVEESKTATGHQFYKVSVKNWYAFGTFDGESAEKYSLKWAEI